MKETDHDAEQDPGHQQQLQNLALLGKDIATAFGTLIGNEQSIIDTAFSSADWKYQFERFGLWADNLGLYHRGHSSLDYRLREAEPLQEFIRCLLIELKEVLSDCECRW